MSRHKKAVFNEKDLHFEVNPINRTYIEEYREKLNEEEVVPVTIRSYLVSLDKIFRYKENWNVEFKNYNNEIYKKFQHKMEEYEFSPSSINNHTIALKNFAKFLQDKYPKDFDRYFLDDIKAEYNKESKKAPARSLKLYELNDLKEYLRIEKHAKTAYVFYIYYHYGIKKKEFIHFDPRNINREHKCFLFNNKKYELTDEIYDILNRVETIESLNISTIDYQFELMTKFLQEKRYFSSEETFSHDNVRLTREQ